MYPSKMATRSQQPLLDLNFRLTTEAVATLQTHSSTQSARKAHKSMDTGVFMCVSQWDMLMWTKLMKTRSPNARILLKFPSWWHWGATATYALVRERDEYFKTWCTQKSEVPRLKLWIIRMRKVQAECHLKSAIWQLWSKLNCRKFQ